MHTLGSKKIKFVVSFAVALCSILDEIQEGTNICRGGRLEQPDNEAPRRSPLLATMARAMAAHSPGSGRVPVFGSKILHKRRS